MKTSMFVLEVAVLLTSTAIAADQGALPQSKIALESAKSRSLSRLRQNGWQKRT